MGLYQRTWIKDISSDSKMYPDSVYMYDAGNFVGILTLKEKTKLWQGFSVVSRVNTQDIIEELLESVDDFAVPMKFFSIEHYPARIEASTLWIPGWKIQMSQKHQQQQQQHRATEALGSQSSLSSHPPLNQHRHQVQRPLSLQPAQLHRSPSSPHPQKSLSGTQGQSQHSSQNKRNIGPKPKALPSSNQVYRETPKQLIQEKSGVHLLQSSQDGHISPLLHLQPTSQSSLSLQPPLAPGGSNLQSTSSSPNPSNLKQNLPSQQARRQHEDKSRHPISSQKFSHE